MHKYRMSFAECGDYEDLSYLADSIKEAKQRLKEWLKREHPKEYWYELVEVVESYGCDHKRYLKEAGE